MGGEAAEGVAGADRRMLRTGCIHRPRPPAVQRLSTRVGAVLRQPRNWFVACPADGNMLGNDTWGCCVPVADYRFIETVLANADGSPDWKPSLGAVLARYAAITGYPPPDYLPDAGTDTNVDLVAWTTGGIRLPEIQRDIVPAWCSVDPLREDRIDRALSLAPCLVSLNLPVDYGRIEIDPAAWQGVPVPAGIYHRVVLGAPRTVRTWGMDVVMSEAFWERCVVAVDFLGVRDALGVDDLDWDALMADMQALAA